METRAICIFVLGVVLIQEALPALVEVVPSEALTLPMQNISVLCRVGVPIQYCRITIPGFPKAFNLRTGVSTSEVSYYGSGLGRGQCGFTLHNIDENNNGLVTCSLGLEKELTDSEGQMHLTVARRPRIPEMDLSRGPDYVSVYKVNDVLQASCTVREGRPVANISWYLDDEPLYRDGLSMPDIKATTQDNLETKIQNLTRILQARDNGKYLKCVAYHPAYPNGRAETQRQLDVNYGPLPQGELDMFGYTIGQPGLITVVVEANPKPQFEWDIGPERIREGYTDQTGETEAEPAKDLGRSQYEVNLRIMRIQKKHTEELFHLTAYNDLGTQDYIIKISTSPEPEGLELGAGGIIGIVVTILIAMLVIFLVVFAKVTDRWCFSSGATVIDYTTGDIGQHPPIDGMSDYGVVNPHHQVSDEYLNGNDLPIKKDSDTAV